MLNFILIEFVICYVVIWTEAFPDHQIPIESCEAVTIELRGEVCVNDIDAKNDALSILRFLTRRGIYKWTYTHFLRLFVCLFFGKYLLNIYDCWLLNTLNSTI